MKIYKIRAGDKVYPLVGLTQNVKAVVTDEVIVEKHRGNDRRLKAGKITPLEHAATAERIDALLFISHSVGKFLTTDDGQRILIRVMLGEADDPDRITDADVDAMMTALADRESAASFVFRRIFLDAYPKLEDALDPKADAPSSPPTPTAGGGNSPESPSILPSTSLED